MMVDVGDYIPKKPKPKRKPKSKAQVIEVQPAVELCSVCNHLKYKAVKHVDGSSYYDNKRCLNCPTCKELRVKQHERLADATPGC